MSSEGTTYKWRVNLDVIEDFLSKTQNPHYTENSKFEGKTLFIGGARSDYRISDHRQSIMNFFPKAKIEMLEGAGEIYYELVSHI